MTTKQTIEEINILEKLDEDKGRVNLLYHRLEKRLKEITNDKNDK